MGLCFEKARFSALRAIEAKAENSRFQEAKTLLKARKSQAGSCLLECRFEAGSSKMRGTRMGRRGSGQTRVDWRGMCSLSASFPASAPGGWGRVPKCGAAGTVLALRHCRLFTQYDAMQIEPKHHHHPLRVEKSSTETDSCAAACLSAKRKTRFLILILASTLTEAYQAGPCKTPHPNRPDATTDSPDPAVCPGSFEVLCRGVFNRSIQNPRPSDKMLGRRLRQMCCCRLQLGA